MSCKGRNLETVCCITSDWRCPHLEEFTEPGYRWTCGLRRELGSWDAVLEDQRYKDGPGEKFKHFNVNCKDWPDWSLNHACAICGENMDLRNKE